jgi:hypothetical protein
MLSLLFLSGYFLVIILFMLGYARIPTDYKEAFAGLLSLMTGGGLTILYFWFSRNRSTPIAEPNTEVTMRTVATTPAQATQVNHDQDETIDRPAAAAPGSVQHQPIQNRSDR